MLPKDLQMLESLQYILNKYMMSPQACPLSFPLRIFPSFLTPSCLMPQNFSTSLYISVMVSMMS